MSMHSARAALREAYDNLQLRWQRTGEQWNDQAMEKFTRHFIDPLSRPVRVTLAAMDQMSGLLTRARQDCEDRESF